METALPICKYCHKTIDASKGRRDRRFCDEICKNKFHNTQTWEEEREIKRIQLILKKNRRVLKKLQARKNGELVERDRLLREGFNFDYHTHILMSKIKNYPYTFCFDYGYRVLRNDTYKIVKAFEYKDE